MGQLALYAEIKLLNLGVAEIRIDSCNCGVRNCSGRIVRIGRWEIGAFWYSLPDHVRWKEIAGTGAEHKIKRLLPELSNGGAVVALRIIEYAVSAANDSLAVKLVGNADSGADRRKVGIYVRGRAGVL